MPQLLIYLFILLLLFCLELLYFRIANHYNIIDKPNERSSHTAVTLRGGGIIFPLAALLFYACFGFQYPLFLLGVTAISIISFLDDLHTLNNKIRIIIHLMSVSLLFQQWGLFILSWYWIIAITIIVIGTINAYNFMDGINGITGLYSLITIATLYCINESLIDFTSRDLLLIIALALVVFNYFNFRKKAKCFAGDVGSVSIAFVIIFLIGQLIVQTQNLLYFSLLLIYGLDAVSTILFRLIKKENIFQAHRSHFYQYLANERRWSHLGVSGLYGLLQLMINSLLLQLVIPISDNLGNSAVLLGGIAIVCGIGFIGLRLGLEGGGRLIGKRF